MGTSCATSTHGCPLASLMRAHTFPQVLETLPVLAAAERPSWETARDPCTNAFPHKSHLGQE
eukprot:14159486-Alexandrium_andersonii.AAC.1